MVIPMKIHFGPNQVEMMMKTGGLGRTWGGLEAVQEGGVCGGGGGWGWSLVPFQTHGIATCHQNTLYCQTWVTVIGTVGLESRIFYSSQFPWLGLFPCDKRRRRRVSWSATVFVLLTHSPTHSLPHSFSLTPTFLLLFFFCTFDPLFVLILSLDSLSLMS